MNRDTLGRVLPDGWTITKTNLPGWGDAWTLMDPQGERRSTMTACGAPVAITRLTSFAIKATTPAPSGGTTGKGE